MVDLITLNVILMVLNIANVIAHSIGVKLLYQLKRNGNESVQNIYVKNLSITELVLNSIVLVERFAKTIPQNPTVAVINTKVHYYFLILSFTGIALVYYFMMFYLTLDKLFEVYLNIRYSVYWNERKAKRLVRATWTLGLAVSLSISIGHAYNGFKFEVSFCMYLYPLLNFLFILTSVFVYCYLFHVYKETRSVPMIKGLNIVFRKPRLYDVFRGSTFYIPVCLILTFLLFFVIPSLIFSVFGIRERKLTPTMMIGLWISEAISTLVDAFIYIFMTKKIRKLFCKMFRISTKQKMTFDQKENYLDCGIAILPNGHLNNCVYQSHLETDGLSTCSTETCVVNTVGQEVTMPNVDI